MSDKGFDGDTVFLVWYDNGEPYEDGVRWVDSAHASIDSALACMASSGYTVERQGFRRTIYSKPKLEHPGDDATDEEIYRFYDSELDHSYMYVEEMVVRR